MLSPSKTDVRNRCGRCKGELGLKEPVKWQEVTEGGQVAWQIWCALCIEDVSVGHNLSWDKEAWFICDDCDGAEMAEKAEASGWHVDPDYAGTFCQFCIQVLRGRADDPIPLSCTSKSQENEPLKAEGRDWLKWCQVSLAIVFLVSIGGSFHALILLSLLGSMTMIFVRWFAEGKRIKLPLQKPLAKKSKNSVTKAVRRWLERYTHPDLPF